MCLWGKHDNVMFTSTMQSNLIIEMNLQSRILPYFYCLQNRKLLWPYAQEISINGTEQDSVNFQI
jgi:hypothetical protein